MTRIATATITNATAMRIDKYIWAIRCFKTRTEATDACKGNKDKVGGVDAQPSREVKVGDEITVRKGAVLHTFIVRAFPNSRVGAPLVPQYADNLTPESELEKLHAPVETFFVRRDRGSGRPTKKERRELDALWDELD